MRISQFLLSTLFLSLYSISAISQVNTCDTPYLCDGNNIIGNDGGYDYGNDCEDGSDELIGYCCANADIYYAYGVDEYGIQACNDYEETINSCDTPYLCDGNNIIGNDGGLDYGNDCEDGSDEFIAYCCANADMYDAYGEDEFGIQACSDFFAGTGGGGGGDNPCESSDQIILTNLAFTDGNSETGSIWESYYELPTSISYNNTNPLNLIDPGRSVRFKIQAYNNLTNGTNLVGASCEIFSDDEYAEITDATAGLNNVGWHESGWSTDEFEIYISSEAPAGHVVNFDFKVTQLDNNWFTKCVKLPVRPIIISNMSIDDDANPDSNGDGDGIIEEGETVEVLPIAENVSTLSVPLLGGKFYSSNNCINVWNGVPGSSGIVQSSSWWNYQFNEPQSIGAGDGNLQPQFDFVFDYSCNNSPFELSVLFSGGFELFDVSNLADNPGLSNKKSLIRFSSPTGYNGWVENNIQDNDNQSSIEVFPNPTSGVINVVLTNTIHNTTTIKLTNILGEVFYLEGLTNFNGQYNKEIDLSKNPKGIYFLEISSPTNTFTKKIILQ